MEALPQRVKGLFQFAFPLRVGENFPQYIALLTRWHKTGETGTARNW